jgi:hypothetical protein
MESHGEGALRVSLGGKAEVCCVHNREKRQVTTEERLMELADIVNFRLKKGVHFIFNCTCCDNLFVDEGTEPRYCVLCRGPLVHPLGGPLKEPEGVVA